MMSIKLLPALLTLVVAAPTLAAGAGDTSPSPAARSPGSGIMRYDTNRDGFVDRAEWTAGQDARFKQLDTDKDGKLSKDEFFSRARQASGPVLPNDRTLERQDSFFSRVDTDRDGAISKTEFMAQADRNFARCDIDKDGRTNTAECRQALRRPSTERVGAQR